MSTLEIQTARVFAPLLDQARYKGAYGGRGSGKSQNFANNLIDKALSFPGDAGEGLNALCVREIQKSLKQSAKKLIEKKLIEFRLGEADGFKVYENVIKTPGNGVFEFQGLQDHTAESVKSFENFHVAWGEESQTLSQKSLDLLIPTIRWESLRLGMISELWFGWNPRFKADPIDKMFRSGEPPINSVCVQSNWNNNPWFPDILNQERLHCLKNNPDNYDHIWEGGYVTFVEGAYYAKQLAMAKAGGRISDVNRDPLMSIYAMFDIGGTGHKSDATAIWIMQQIGLSIRVLDYYEARGQELSEHVFWLKDNGYERAEIVLPHDGDNMDKVHRVSFKTEFEAAGFKVHILKNQGVGAAMKRIEAVRRAFPNVWINKSKCSAGLDALGAYAPLFDEKRGVDLGVNHNWASHGADAFGTGIVWLAQRPSTQKSAANQTAKLRSIGTRRYN